MLTHFDKNIWPLNVIVIFEINHTTYGTTFSVQALDLNLTDANFWFSQEQTLFLSIFRYLTYCLCHAYMAWPLKEVKRCNNDDLPFCLVLFMATFILLESFDFRLQSGLHSLVNDQSNQERTVLTKVSFILALLKSLYKIIRPQ